MFWAYLYSPVEETILTRLSSLISRETVACVTANPALLRYSSRTSCLSILNSLIRESILNTIVHRDYDVCGSTLINIYENNIEIVNLGGLVGGLTVDAIKKGSSATRNPKLASIFHRLNYIEAYGSGIPRILSKYANQQRKPSIEVTDNSFFVTFPKLEFGNEKINEDKILNYMQTKGKVSREEIEKLLNCSKTTALRKLNEYVKNEQIRKVSIGKETYYELN